MIIRYSLPDGKTATFETEANAIIIGRGPCSDPPVDLDLVSDDYISHQHARLIFEHDRYWVEDLDSANGTWVNGVLITRKTRFGAGDRIRVGWTRLTIAADLDVDEDATDIDKDFPTVINAAEEIPAGTGKVVVNVDAGNNREAADPEPEAAPRAAAEPPVRKKRLAASFLEKPEDDAAAGTGSADSICADRVRATLRYKAKPDDEPAADPEPKPAPRKMADPPVRKKGLAASFLEQPEQEPVDTEPAGDTWESEDRTILRNETPPGVGPVRASFPDLDRLQVLSDLSARIGGAESLASLMPMLKKNLPRMIPNAQRGAVLLPDERGKLLLKAHWPQGEHSVSMTWIKQAFEEQKAFLWSVPDKHATGFDTPDSAFFYKVQSAIYVPLMVGREALGVMYVDNFYMREAFSPAELEMMKTLAGQVAQFIKLRVLDREDERQLDMRSVFLRQFPPRIAEVLAGRYSSEKVGGEKVDPVTILVSDVRNFTVLSAEMEPDAVVRMINEMFDALVPIVFEYDGVVDKFVGDSVLAVFGSPEPDDHQWEKAVRAALEMQNSVRMLGEGRRARRLPVFEVGISVHSGEVIHGFIGSQQRTEYTIIGDAVNKAARLCDGAGPGEIVISQPVFEQVYGIVDVVPKSIKTKHADVEPELKAYVVKGIRERGG